MTKGSGVYLDKYIHSPEPLEGKIRVMLAARMIKDKGIMEYIEAALSLKSEYAGTVQFLLCGDLDTNPTAISKEYLTSICDGEYLQWLGHCPDMISILKTIHIAVLPSYREGLPKSLIEAAATGRAIITTDSAGCKECVIDGYNGFLVPVKNSAALAEKIRFLIDNPEVRKEMGRNSRLYAEQNFSIEDVINTHLEIYKRLIAQ
jgi:glycosyltransferase involved in cell wall biosynthesis